MWEYIYIYRNLVGLIKVNFLDVLVVKQLLPEFIWQELKLHIVSIYAFDQLKPLNTILII